MEEEQQQQDTRTTHSTSSDLVFDDQDMVLLSRSASSFEDVLATSSTTSTTTTTKDPPTVSIQQEIQEEVDNISDLPPLIPFEDDTADFTCGSTTQQDDCQQIIINNNKATILNIVRNSPILPPKSDLEDTFPPELYLDRDIVLAFCQRHDLAKLHEERGFTVPDLFTSDRPIMLEYCGNVPEALQQCSMDLRSDPSIVRAAVRLDGAALQYAGLELMEDRDLIRLACQSNPCALAFCLPGPALQSILHDQELMMRMLERIPTSSTTARIPEALDILWKLAPDYWKENDPEFVTLALKAGLGMDDFPPHMLRSDYLEKHPTLAQALILVHPDCYLTLVDQDDWIRHQEDLAYRALVSANSNAKIHSKALEYFPELPLQHRDVVLSISQRGDLNVLEDILAKNSEWADDEEVIQYAVERDDERFTKLASKRLRLRLRMRRRRDPNTRLLSSSPK